MPHIQSQCWICPLCHDDRHHKTDDAYCRAMQRNALLHDRLERAEARVADLEKVVDDGSDAWLLRKQADAIEPTVMMDWEDTRNLVKSLRQQADELDND